MRSLMKKVRHSLQKNSEHSNVQMALNGIKSERDRTLVFRIPRIACWHGGRNDTFRRRAFTCLFLPIGTLYYLTYD